jgi:tetratricopeptide (TPR) repeat protein
VASGRGKERALGFLDAFKGNPLRRLEEEAEANPSPETVAALAQKHIELGELDKAIQVADRALHTFKNSAKLKDIVSFVRKKQSQDTVKHLRDEIRVKPSALAYSQLANIYRDLGDIDQALDLLNECTAKFPDEHNAFRMVAQVRLEIFLQEVIAYDGLHALRALRRVREVSPEDSSSRLLFAQLLYAVGANALAVEELRAELEKSPTALDLKEFLDDLGTPAPLDAETTIETLIERCEESGALVNSLQGFPRVKPGIAQRTSAAPKINPVAATAKVQELAAMPGLGNVAVLDREGKSIAAVRTGGGLEGEAFRDLAWGVESVAWECCRRMDVGSFVRGSVLFPGGGIAFVRRRGTTFALGFEEPMKPDRAAAVLEELVIKIVGGGGA